MIQQFTFDGTGRQIDARGVTFRYESGTDSSGVTDLRLWIDGNAVGTLSPGDLLEIPEAAKRWEVRPVSSSCTGVIKIGMGKITTTKVAGIVSTVDGAKDRVIQGNALSAYAWQVAVAGNYSRVQLWNPVGSTKNIILNRATVCVTSTVGVHFSFLNAPLSTQVQNLISKKSGISSTSIGSVRSDATTTPSVAVGLLKGIVSVSGQNYEYQPTEPIVLRPGWGLVLATSAMNSDLGGSFDCWEEPV